MKFWATILTLFLVLIIVPSINSSVQAHLVGQAPFLKINDKYANLYSVPLTSLSDFDLPQDQAPENYLVGQGLVFELDKRNLPAPPEIIAKTKFTWDWGDGTTSEGLQLPHTFSRMGTYIIKIHADDGSTPTPQLLESAMLHILPDKNYQLPKAVILINGKQSKDPLTDVLSVNIKESVKLDASQSKGGADITDYFWDLGDQTSSTQAVTTHKYKDDSTQIFPLLRVKDKNGFFTDNFVEVQNDQVSQIQNNPLGSAKPADKRPIAPSQLPVTIMTLGILAVIVFMARRLSRGRDRGKKP